VAKPGYAVGGIHARVGLRVDGFEFIYMRIKGNRLDPRDYYQSEWLGAPEGGGDRQLIGQGQPVVGIYGSYKDLLSGLGFLVAGGGKPQRGPTQEQVVRSDPLGGMRDTPFEELAPAGGMLVGAKVTYADSDGRPQIDSIQPLFLVDEKHVPGKRHGGDPGSVRSIAKPGYAVGAIKARAGALVHGLQLVYMRIDGDRLDPSDSYESEILGGTQGGSLVLLGGEGRPVVGLRGAHEKLLRGVGLLHTRP
jgi:hypothetical protein